MKVIADTLGVARSNLAEQAAPPRSVAVGGRSPRRNLSPKSKC